MVAVGLILPDHFLLVIRQQTAMKLGQPQQVGHVGRRLGVIAGEHHRGNTPLLQTSNQVLGAGFDRIPFSHQPLDGFALEQEADRVALAGPLVRNLFIKGDVLRR